MDSTIWRTVCSSSYSLNGPNQRAAHISQIVGDKLVVFGGWNGSAPLNDVYVFDFESQKWIMCCSVNPGPSSRNNVSLPNVFLYFLARGRFNG